MKKIIVFLCMFFCSLEAIAEVIARTNALSFVENEPVILELSSNSAQNKPDYSVLKKEFDILDERMNVSSFVFGGNVSLKQHIILVLKPKKTGSLTIPAFPWDGQKTQPIQIEVKAASNELFIKGKKVAFIEAKLSDQKYYEGAGIYYQVKVFEQIGVVKEAFVVAQSDDVEFIPLGEYKKEPVQKDGQWYWVFTQDYVIFPKKSGKLEIPSVAFSANLGAVFIRTKSMDIDVFPRPKDTQNQWWLPTPKLLLSEKWTGLEEVKVGQPITRNIELKAFGVLGNMLPDIQIPNSEDFKIYAENAQKTEVYENGNLIAIENRTFVFIPLKSGKLMLPEVVVSWFDVKEGVLKKAKLMAQEIEVLDNPNLINTTDQTPSSLSSEKKENTSIQRVKETPFSKENNLLYFLSGLSLGLLIGGIGMLIVYHRKIKKKKLAELYPQN